MNKKALRLIPSIILYILAIALVAFAYWAYTQCSDIITQARAAGQLPTTGVAYDIASFYMVNCGLYFALAALMAACGLILQRRQPAQLAAAPPAAFPIVGAVEAVNGEVDDDEAVNSEAGIVEMADGVMVDLEEDIVELLNGVVVDEEVDSDEVDSDEARNEEK